MPDPQPVLLVGAGPGDPRLITLAGADALRRADVVLYDRLAAPELLDLAAGAELIDVGKAPRGHTITQDNININQQLINHARRGQRIVRLKGGEVVLAGRLLSEDGETSVDVQRAGEDPDQVGLEVAERLLERGQRLMGEHHA